MFRRQFFSATSLILLALLSFQLKAQTISQQEPTKLVSDLSSFIVKALNEKRLEFEANPAKVKQFAHQYVLPYVDTEKMARYALGKNWRTASSAQQSAFTKAFTDNLIRSYSQSFLDLKVDSVEVAKAVMDRRGRATVSSTVYQQQGKPANVLYRVYQDKTSQKWYLYDVVIENVSMLLSYRSVYSSAVASKGLDNVIAELEQKNRQTSEAP